MTFFVSTAMGFITSNKVDRDHPKKCIDQSRSRDVRWAHPFSSWDEANRFATELTNSPNWPPHSRYYAIMTSASPNTRADVQQTVEALKNPRALDRLKAFLNPTPAQSTT